MLLLDDLDIDGKVGAGSALAATGSHKIVTESERFGLSFNVIKHSAWLY